jgi:AcrR family transcriptional regulator
MEQKTRKIKRTTRDEWLSAALKLLGEKGVDGVKVERLARILGVSKGGFYWHFKNRRDFLKYLLDFWRHEYTEVVIENPDIRKGSPESRLHKVMNMIDEYELTKYEIPMRAWATHDPVAYQAVQEVYNIRMKTLRKIFSDLGFEGDDLEMRTRLFVCYHSWERPMYPGDSKRRLNRLQKLRLSLLTKK